MIKYYQDNNQNLRKEYDSMKKLSAVLFAALCIILVISLCICIYGVWDIICAAGDLANDPSASGIDYMGLGWGTAIALMVSSALGLILSCISRKMQRLQYLLLVYYLKSGKIPDVLLRKKKCRRTISALVLLKLSGKDVWK